MKTSNKILIAFALALIVIPVLGMVYVSNVHFTSAKNAVDLNKNDDHFDQASPQMNSMAIATAFNAVNIADAKNIYFSIRVVKSTQFGIKVSERFKDLVTTTVDGNGQLQIAFKGAAQNDRAYGTILIYAPAINALAVKHANGLEINVQADSLQLNFDETGHIRFTEETKVNKLAVVASHVRELFVAKEVAPMINLTLNDASFKSEGTSYQYLNIKTTGTSLVELEGNEKQSIASLVLNTEGQATVKFTDIKIVQCAGSFSDESTIQMPAVNLNQMFKSRK